jgi:hypothetical protein
MSVLPTLVQISMEKAVLINNLAQLFQRDTILSEEIQTN